MMIADLRCACGSADIIAWAPGYAPVRSDVPGFNVLLYRGAPSVARCRACAMRAFVGFGRREATNG